LEDFYTVARELGSGGFSTVRLGVNKKTGVEVAIKTILKSRACEGDNALIRNEISIMTYVIQNKAIMNTTHVVNMLDVFDEPKAVHVILEMCAGGELFERIVQKGHYSEQDAARVVKQICQGLKGLHTVNILHRDMKPENILYRGEDEHAPLVIVDFGLSMIKGQPDAMDGLFGSLDYISPEALLKKYYCEATDMWATGVILFILLSGYPPFWADNTRGKQTAIIKGTYDFNEPIWSKISDEAKNLIKGLLQVDPTKRSTVDEVLDHSWLRNIEHVNNSPLPNEVAVRISQFNAKRKFRAAAYAAVCMARSMKSLRSNLSKLSGIKTLSEAELLRIRTAFKEVGGSAGGISLTQLAEVMTSLNITFPNIDKVFELFDENSDGSVDQRELIMGLALLRETPTDEHFRYDDKGLRFCFDVYDTDGNGMLSRDELSSVLRMMADQDQEGAIQADVIGDLFETLDADMDGQVSFEEFKAAVAQKPFLMDHILQPIRSATFTE